MISAIVPNYNHSKYLKQRIDSVLNQTYTDYELIILDDCSLDDSRSIIEGYRNHPKVSQIIYNEENSGSTFKQWDKALSLAQGEYIWIAESDDWAAPDLLATLFENITKEDDIVLSYCQSNKVNSSGDITGTWLEQVKRYDNGVSVFSQNFICTGVDFIKDFLLEKNVIPNASAVLFRKDAYIIAGGVDLNVRACSDWLLWLKILTIGKVAFSSLHLNYFRYHEESVIATVWKNEPQILLKNFDLQVRTRYNIFLKGYDLQYLIEKNNYFIEKDYIIVIFECYNHKKYIKMLDVFIKTLFCTNNKRRFINRFYKYLLKK